MKKYRLTHALKLLFKLRLVLTIGDPKVVVRVGALINTIGRSCCSDGQHSGRTFRPLSLAYFIYSHHFLLIEEVEVMENWR